MKEKLNLGSVDMLGHTQYIGILPARSCVDGIRSMDSLELHKLFADAKTFDLPDGDPLITAFAGYSWIVTFLGEPYGSFEQNLIFTANCSHSAEVVTLSLKPPAGLDLHVSDYYIRQFACDCGLSIEAAPVPRQDTLITPTQADAATGQRCLREIGCDLSRKLVVIHPGSGGLEKCWHVDNFITLAQEIERMGNDVVFLLGPAEMERLDTATMNRISGAAKCLASLPLSDVVGVLSCADGFVGNDSGITHLAASLGRSTIALFGPTHPARYRPLGPDVKILSLGGEDFASRPSPLVRQQVLAHITQQRPGVC
jgi:hypothetical protein